MSSMSNDDPITGIGVIESINHAPQGYTAISTTVDGRDADIWKDGFFSRQVRRYICYTKVFPLDNGRWRNVVKDIKIVKDSADVRHPGYVVISQTMGSEQKQPALQGHRLLIKNEPRETCDGAFTDLVLISKGGKLDKTVSTNYIKIGELNGMFLYGKWKNLPAPNQNVCNGKYPSHTTNQFGALNNFNDNNDETAEGFTVVGGAQNSYVNTASTAPVFRPNNQWSAMTLERQKSEILTTGIDGITFQIHPKYLNCSTAGNGANSVFVLPHFEIKSAQQIEAESEYSLELEKSIING